MNLLSTPEPCFLELLLVGRARFPLPAAAAPGKAEREAASEGCVKTLEERT